AAGRIADGPAERRVAAIADLPAGSGERPVLYAAHLGRCGLAVLGKLVDRRAAHRIRQRVQLGPAFLDRLVHQVEQDAGFGVEHYRSFLKSSSPVIRGRAGRGKASQLALYDFRSETSEIPLAALPLRPCGPPPPHDGGGYMTNARVCAATSSARSQLMQKRAPGTISTRACGHFDCRSARWRP